jgi:hypothetical protein
MPVNTCKCTWYQNSEDHNLIVIVVETRLLCVHYYPGQDKEPICKWGLKVILISDALCVNSNAGLYCVSRLMRCLYEAQQL